MRALKPFIWSTDAIAQLWVYADSWYATKHPVYMRNALRCKTMALIQSDRIFDNK